MTLDCRWQATIEGTLSLRLNFVLAQSGEPGVPYTGGVYPAAADPRQPHLGN